MEMDVHREYGSRVMLVGVARVSLFTLLRTITSFEFAVSLNVSSPLPKSEP